VRAARRPVAHIMDWSRLDELAEFDTDEREVVRRAIASLAEQAPALLDEMRRGISAADAPLLRNGAHRLKGAASNLGAVALAECASRLEAAGRNGKLNDVETLLDEPCRRDGSNAA
jgi:HPt (histidine-containing phosphotransfer) domain-containing protein